MQRTASVVSNEVGMLTVTTAEVTILYYSFSRGRLQMREAANQMREAANPDAREPIAARAT